MSEKTPGQVARKYAFDLNGEATYRFLMEQIEKLRPVVPRFDYKDQSNFEEIKFKLAQLQMYTNIMSILKPEAQNER